MNIIWYNTISSTNTEALCRLSSLESGSVLAAKEQTAGRGQRGNKWFTEPGKNLTFSIVQKFPAGQLKARDAHWLNYVISEAVAAFLQVSGVDCKIKWPNDIYVGHKKICGILIENVLEGDSVSASVIGVGLNINQKEFPQLANATSLFNCTGRERDLNECLEELMAIYEKTLPMLWDSKEELFKDYSSKLFQLGTQASYNDYLREKEFRGVIKGVASDGRLHITDLDEMAERYYSFKEVGYIL